MVIEYQIRKGNKILGKYSSREKAGRRLAQVLYTYNNFHLVKVVKKR